jgi:ankyrin repeat protein
MDGSNLLNVSRAPMSPPPMPHVVTDTVTKPVVVETMLRRDLESAVQRLQRTAGVKRTLSGVHVADPGVKPGDLALQLFLENGFDLREVDLLQQIPFLKPTPEMIQGYQAGKINLVRKRDLKGIKDLVEKGESFSVCNRFGESLIHMACRRGSTELVDFLVHDAKVSLLVRDDYGRTSLHDAFWTCKPNFELVALLLTEIPEFLCIRDVRGHTPLDYIRKGDSQAWRDFLLNRKDLLVPRHVLID